MTNLDSIIKFIDKLEQSTISGKAKWKNSSLIDKYLYHLKDSPVVISIYYDVDKDGFSVYKIQVMEGGIINDEIIAEACDIDDFNKYKTNINTLLKVNNSKIALSNADYVNIYNKIVNIYSLITNSKIKEDENKLKLLEKLIDKI
jgi:hypothetical protein